MNTYKISEDEAFCCRCEVRLHEDTNWKDERSDEDGDYFWCDKCGDKEEDFHYECWKERQSEDEEGEE